MTQKYKPSLRVRIKKWREKRKEKLKEITEKEKMRQAWEDKARGTSGAFEAQKRRRE